MKNPRSFAVICGLVMLCSGTGVSFAQQASEDEEAELGWFNATELSIVLTGGNSDTQTFGFRNTLRKVWPTARFRFKLDGVRSKTADDRFLLIDPGITFPPGGTPSDFTTSLVEPNLEPDVEQYFAEGRFERNISERFFWHGGGSWDRNNDAGILNRYIVFAGVGNIWSDREDLRFSTAYGVSYTDREEKEPDPEKDTRFGGLRLSWDYLNAFGAFTVYENDLTTNMSLKAASDYSLNMSAIYPSDPPRHLIPRPVIPRPACHSLCFILAHAAWAASLPAAERASPGVQPSPLVRPFSPSSSPRSVTTMAAPLCRSDSGSSLRSTPMTSPKPPSQPACTPEIASSTTTAR